MLIIKARQQLEFVSKMMMSQVLQTAIAPWAKKERKWRVKILPLDTGIFPSDASERMASGILEASVLQTFYLVCAVHVWITPEIQNEIRERF